MSSILIYWNSFFVIVALACSVAALVLITNENFTAMKFPKAGVAQKGQYTTYNRECPEGSVKCKVESPLQQKKYYFCSEKETPNSDDDEQNGNPCHLVDENVKGVPMGNENALSWSEIYA